jgi:hypothetical protein
VDANHVLAVIETTEVGPPSPWSRWVYTPRPACNLPPWSSYRTRRVTLRVEVLRIRQSCVRKCPPGYRPIGNSCEWWDRSHPRPALPAHRVSSHGESEIETYESTRLEFRWASTAPWGALVKVIRDMIVIGDADTSGGEMGPEGNEPYIQPIPALCLGDRLVFRALKSGQPNEPVEGEPRLIDDDEGAYEVEIDGRSHPSDEDVVATDLGEGFHLMVFSGEDEALGTLQVQVPLSIVHPLAFKRTAVTRLSLSGSTNGGTVAMVLSNRSGAEHAVQIELASVPAGWMALLLDNPVFVLGAGESKEITVQIERMVTWQQEGSLSFTVGASLPGSDLPDTTTTFWVEVTDEETSSSLPNVVLAEPLLTGGEAQQMD